MEVMSKEAFATFLTNMKNSPQNCPSKWNTHAHFRYYGEDFYDKFMCKIGAR
jgi:hypothetical protein